MSGGEPLEVVRRFYATLNDPFDSRTELLSEDLVYRPVKEIADAAEFHGVAGFREYIEGWEGVWDGGITYNVEGDLRQFGERVVGLVRFTGRGLASGLEMTGRAFQVYTVRDGLIVRLEDFTSRAEALAAAGAQE